MTAYELRQLIESEGKVEAVNRWKENPSPDAADAFIHNYVYQFLNSGLYAGAAMVLWGTRLFDVRPLSVKRVWKAVQDHAKVLIPGAASVGKTYTVVGWHLLDWWRDPIFTNVKVISTTAGHAKGNAFSTLVRLHRAACVSMPGEILNDYIGLDSKDRKSGIAVVAIPDGDDGSGRLQGFHPDPRPKPHPTLGDSSRVRAYLDEAEHVPAGVWGGVDNAMIAQYGPDLVKVSASFNPKDLSSRTAANAEPFGGWEMFDLDTGVNGSDDWESRNGWHVCRIDGAKSENVRHRKMIFPGFISYEGYRELEDKGGGNTPEFFTYGRGAYPPESSVNIIIHSSYIQTCRGNFVFLGATIPALGADIAVDGRDEAVATIGRFGKATAFDHLLINKATGTPSFERITFPQTRGVVQADQQIILHKGSTRIVANNVRETAKAFGVDPGWVCIDRTGNGATIHDFLMEVWSEEVQGIDFSKPATETKVLAQDTVKCSEVYDGIVTEVWFALARWMEFGAFGIAPGLRADPLEQQLRGRRYLFGAGKKRRVEKKDDFKFRLGASPDHADSLMIFLHGIRMRSEIIASMTGMDRRQEKLPPLRHGTVDKVVWLE